MKSFQNFINIAEKVVASSGRAVETPDPVEQDIEDFQRERSKHRPRPSKKYKSPEEGVSWQVSKNWERKVSSTPEEILSKVENKPSSATPVTQRASTGNIVKVSVKKPNPSAPKPAPVSAVALTPPKPKVVTPAPAPAPKPETIDLGRVNREPLKIQKPSPVQVTTVANKPISSSEKIANAVVKASNQVRSDIAAEKAAETAKTMKRMGRLGALTTGIGAAVDAASVYTQKRGEGYSKPRALGAGLSQAGGGLAGAATGARIGGAIAGLPGAVVGGIGGYTVGSGAGKEIFKAVTGDPSTKLTTQGVLTNIRKSVPQNIRAQVPANVRKGFTDFVKASGRAYGNWRRSQEGK